MSWERLLKKYANKDLCIKQIAPAINAYKDLRPSIQKFVHNDGRETELFALQGTIPAHFRGSTYNIPICMFLEEMHPIIPPIIYVRPTNTMAIKASKHVDSSGKVYLPYLSEWDHPKSDLTALIQILCCVFGEQPPVYAKLPGCAPPLPFAKPNVPEGRFFQGNAARSLPYPAYPLQTVKTEAKDLEKKKNDNATAAEKDFSELHLDEQYDFSKPWKNSDVVLIVEGQSLHVHRVILEMASPIFQAMFSECSIMPRVNLPKKNAKEFVDFLEQIYTQQFTSEITMQNIGHIYDLAEEFQVKIVLDACKKFLANQKITSDNIGKLLKLAERFQCEDVCQDCLSRLRNLNFKALKSVQLDAQSLQEIVIPKAMRMEKCVEELLPQLLWFIDCAVYFWSNYNDKDLNTNTKRGMMAEKPKLCEKHYVIGANVACEGPKTSLTLENVEERVRCKECMSMLMEMKRLSYHTIGGRNTPETLREIFDVLYPAKPQNELAVCNNIQAAK